MGGLGGGEAEDFGQTETERERGAEGVSLGETRGQRCLSGVVEGGFTA